MDAIVQAIGLVRVRYSLAEIGALGCDVNSVAAHLQSLYYANQEKLASLARL